MASSDSVAVLASAHAFDAVASEYDVAFTDRLLGRWLREIVWQRLGNVFEPGQHILELGCGTGEDAVWLARRGLRVTATDASPAMLEITRHKADIAGVSAQVNVAALDLNSLDSADVELNDTYDGIVSNFGPLNCVEDRRALAGTLARIVRPGGRVVLVVMGPACPWEIAWFLGHGKVRAAFRRFRSGQRANVGRRGGVRVWYPSPRRLRLEFESHFTVLETAGVGLLLPPSALGGLVDRAPRFFALLARVDRRLAETFPWRWLNDHYLVVLERR